MRYIDAMVGRTIYGKRIVGGLLNCNAILLGVFRHEQLDIMFSTYFSVKFDECFEPI